MTSEAVTDVRGDALRLLSGGLYVLTACAADTIHAAAVSWVSQVSFQPPLVLVALRRNSHLAQAVRKAHRFALNILGSDQVALAEPFLGSRVAACRRSDRSPGSHSAAALPTARC